MEPSMVFLLIFVFVVGIALGYLIETNLRKGKQSKYFQEYQILDSKFESEAKLRKSLEASIEQYRDEINTTRNELTKYRTISENLQEQLSQERQTKQELESSLVQLHSDLKNAHAETTKYRTKNESIEQRLLEIQTELDKIQIEIKESNQEKINLKESIAQKEEQLRSQEEQKQFLERTRADLRTQFEALSTQILKNSREELINTNRITISEPFTNQVRDLKAKLEEVNQNNLTKLQELQLVTNSLIEKSTNVQDAAHQLTNALRHPNIKGTWGEVNLRRILEFVGLINYCDFQEQLNVSNENQFYRPDCVITIPGERKLIIDCKTPLDSYMEAVKSTDETLKKSAIINHIGKVKLHIDELSKKGYASKLSDKEEVIDAVILFIPVEGALSIALENDPFLLEYAFNKKIILTFPTSLLAILKGFSLTIQQRKLAQNIEEIISEAKVLYERFDIFASKFDKVGEKLNQLTVAFNESVSSYKSRLLPQARKIADLSGSNKKIKNTEELNNYIKSLNTQNQI